MRWVDLGSELDLSGGRLTAEFDGCTIVVVRVGDGVHAYEDRCTHDDGPLADADIEDGAIVCPRHGARFCLTTGAVLSPPAYEPLRIFAARVDEGRVLVEVAE